MLPSLQYSNGGEIENAQSPYQATQAEQEILSVADVDLGVGYDIMNRSFDEFNGMSVLQRASLDQKDWLAWSDAPSSNPDDQWMFTGTSGATRRAIISIAAHLTEQVIYPGIFAQNDDDEEDEAAAYVMKTILEYNARRNNYEETFLYGVLSGLVNPVSYFKVDYVSEYVDALNGTQSNFTRKKILDEMFSGFQHSLIPLDEILFGNPYCFEWQKQPFTIHRRRITYGEAKGLYGDHPNFEHVRPGIIATYDPTSGLFYDVEDIEGSLVLEETYSYRNRDVEFTRVNGVYLSNPNTDYLPMRHRRIMKDGSTIPMYNTVKYGAEPIDAQRFWAYKSVAAKLSNDKELVDRMRQNAVDASTFATFPSIFTMGAGKLDKSVFVPATTLEIGKDARINPATGLADPTPAYLAAQEAENQMSKDSVGERFGGSSDQQETARGAIILQRNAITKLGIIGRMITQGLIKPIGELMVDDILRYQTVGETIQLSGGALGMKYNAIILNDKVVDGQNKNIVIRFTDQWTNRNISKEEERKMRVALFEESGDNKVLYEVNPAVWIRRKYLVIVEADALKPMNDMFDRASKAELYDRAIQNPLIINDPEKLAEVTRDFLFEPTVKGEASKYIPKDTKKVLESIIPQAPQREGVVGKTVDRGAMTGLGELSA